MFCCEGTARLMTHDLALPLVDISRLGSPDVKDRRAVADELSRACKDVGFLYVTGSQIDRSLFAKLRDTAQRFFAWPIERKMRSYIGHSVNHSGYVPIGEEQFTPGTHDLKEAYDVNYDYLPEEGRRPLLGPNIWPDDARFQEDVLAYYNHVRGIGRQLFRAFALALGLDEGFFDARTVHAPSQLRLIHYPCDPAATDAAGIGAHTDYECFTLLFPTAPGLEVLARNGAWIDVPLIEGAMVMNIGDMMEVLSNGRFVATRHRVRKVAEERYSFPLFFACDYDCVIEPVVKGEAPRYAPIRGGEHLHAQTAQTFSYLKARIAAGEIVLEDARPLHSFGRKEAEPAQ